MPQGASKKKPGNAATGKKQNVHKRKPQTKKGARTIAPKKAKLVEAQKMQKRFTTSLKAELEGELSARATHVESKSFKVIKPKTTKEGAQPAAPKDT